MRRVALVLVILSLVFSCAVPSGAAFALDDTVIPELLHGEDISEVTAPTNEEFEVVEDLTEEPALEVLEQLFEPAVLQDVEEVPEEEDEPALSYPRVVISELQVSGTCDGGSWCTGSNVEFIELHNPNEFNVSLSGWKLQRQATGVTSQPTNHVIFGDIGLHAGEYAVVVLGLVEPAESILATYTSSLNNTEGSLLLVAPDGATMDTVGWGMNSKTFYATPASAPAANQSIQRCLKDGVLFETNPRNNSLEMLVYEDLGPTPGAGIECAEPPVVNYCEGAVISEIAANRSEQFVEIYNPTPEKILLDGCRVQTNRSAASFSFPENTELGAGQYVVVPIADTNLTLTKTTTGKVYILSSDGLNESNSVEYSGLSEDTSWAQVDGVWRQTYTVTPGAGNVYAQFLPCEEGYLRNFETGRCNKLVETEILTDCGEGRERNPSTGRCRNIPTLMELTPCREGQYRSEETNRCRSIVSSVASILKPCADDQFRNPLTNRCKKIASDEDVALADCGEGRERNPETNRCRNVLGVSTDSAALPFAVEEKPESIEQFVGWWALGVIVVAGLGYGVWEWRVELASAGRRMGQFVRGKK